MKCERMVQKKKKKKRVLGTVEVKQWKKKYIYIIAIDSGWK